MNRREFLGAMAAAPLLTRGQGTATPRRRTFDVTTRVDLPPVKRHAMVWIPAPFGRNRVMPYQELLNGGGSAGNNVPNSSRWRQTEGGVASVMMAEWAGPAPAPWFSTTHRLTTVDRRVSLDASKPVRHDTNLDYYLKPTALIPTDGIVRETALAITKPHGTQLSRARAIYDWIVEHTVRDPEVKGCGTGDIRWMLETRNLSGKCADLNALFVGLARAAGMPARDLYGLRVAPSQLFPSLGRSGNDVTTAQHCRAEVWVTNIGWVPVDPADVRKVILEEKPGSALDDPYIRKVRDTLFGSWEMNWFAYNDAHDVVLPGSSGKPLPFLMYPQAEIDGARRDSLDPASFKYQITVRQI